MLLSPVKLTSKFHSQESTFVNIVFEWPQDESENTKGKKDITSITFIFQDDNFVLSAIFCAIEENNLEGLDKLLSMANIDVNQAGITILHCT